MESKELHNENIIVGNFSLNIKIVEQKSRRQTRHMAYCKILGEIKKPSKSLQKEIDEGIEI